MPPHTMMHHSTPKTVFAFLALGAALAPVVAFGAISYTRTPEGDSPLSPVTVTLAAASFAEFGLSANVDRFYVTLDDDYNPRTECYPVSQFPVTATFDLPPGDVVKGVMVIGFTGFCESGDEPYYLEGDGSSAVFTVSGTSVTPAGGTPPQASVVATKALPIPAKTSSPVTPVVVPSVTAPKAVPAPAPVTPVTGMTSPSLALAAFTRDLFLGMTGADVRALQVWLNTHGFTIAESGSGSLGNETNYFGKLTQSALARYQSSRGITPAVGYFGPKTRASLTTP